MRYVSYELQIIKEYIGKESIAAIAKRINRSAIGLEMKINRMGMSNTKTYSGMMTAGELASVLGIERNTVIGWVNRHGLIAKQRITRHKRKFTFIEVEDFWEWASNNKCKVDFSRLEKNSLPPEPNWVEAERKNTKEKVYRCWTTAEEKILLELSLEKSFKEIARILGRTPYSVEKKYSRLKNNTLTKNIV
jgi:DNA-binding CsgD family transcriptional regulator